MTEEEWEEEWEEEFIPDSCSIGSIPVVSTVCSVSGLTNAGLCMKEKKNEEA